MSHALSDSTRHSHLSSAIAVALVVGLGALSGGVLPTARAASLGVGQSFVVNPGDFPETETFNLLGAALTLRPGVALAGISASHGERLDARLPTNRYEAQAGAQLRLGQNWA